MGGGACTPLTDLHRYPFLAGYSRPRSVTAIEWTQRGHRGRKPNINSVKTSDVGMAPIRTARWVATAGWGWPRQLSLATGHKCHRRNSYVYMYTCILSEMRGCPARQFLGRRIPDKRPEESLMFYFYCDHPKQEPEKIDSSSPCLGWSQWKINTVGIPPVFYRGSFCLKTGARDTRAFQRVGVRRAWWQFDMCSALLIIKLRAAIIQEAPIFPTKFRILTKFSMILYILTGQINEEVIFL